MMFDYTCYVVKIVDGDTVDVDIDLGFDLWLRNQRIRLFGIDTPETRTRDLAEKEAGLKAKKFVEDHLPFDVPLKLVSREFNRGKYGRILADIFTINDKSISQLLLENGLAKPYR